MCGIVTISREYGSGGREIGKRLAEQLGIPFYDKEVLALAAQQSGEQTADFEQMNREVSAFQMSLAMLDPNNRNDRLFVLQSQAIREIAAREPCVIIGRCADYVLRDRADVTNVFISGASLKRVGRIANQGIFAHHRVSEQESQLRFVLEMDKRRSLYYKHYTGQTWGMANNYHLCLDSSRVGAQACEIIRAYLEKSGL